MPSDSALKNRSEIETYLHHARHALESSQSSLDSGFYSTAINRAYYAIFYAASGMLLTKGITSKRHMGVISLFRQHFVKSGLIESEYSRVYGKVMDARIGSDYDMLFDSKQADAQAILTLAQSFVERITTYLFRVAGIQI